MMSRILWCALVSASFLSSPVRADWRPEPIIIQTPDINVLGREVTRKATGYIILIGPDGNEIERKDMPPEGGRIEISALPDAIGGVRVDLDNNRMSSGWVARSASSLTFKTKKDIDLKIKEVPITIPGQASLAFKWTYLPQITDAYFGPEFLPGTDENRTEFYRSIAFGPLYDGELTYELEIIEVTTNYSIFHSISTLTPSSPDIVTDNTGSLKWIRSPGPFGGLSAVNPDFVLPDTPNSQARWVLEFTPQTSYFSTYLDEENNVDQFEFAFIVRTAGWSKALGPSSFDTSGSGGNFFGFSDSAIPEPEAWMMMVAGFGFVGSCLRRRREQLSRPMNLAN